MNRNETHFCSHLSAPGGCEQNKSLRCVSSAHQNESLEGIKDGKVILPAWLGTCTLPRRCSLFTGAAINLHARDYESTARRTEFKSQKDFFKVSRSEQGCGFSDQIEQLSCMSLAAVLRQERSTEGRFFPPFWRPQKFLKVLQPQR